MASFEGGWDEGKHKRGAHGRFGPGATGPKADEPSYDVQFTEGGLESFRQRFGADFAEGNLARLAGAQPGAVVRVHVNEDDEAFIHVFGDGYHAERHLAVGPGEPRTISNDELTVDKTGHGLGTRILATQVAEARRWGYKGLSTYAAGDADDEKRNGYYTWPLLGYNAQVPAAARAQLRSEYKKAGTLHDLLALPGGTDAWREAGCSLSCSFDLRDGSRSLAILSAYARQKGLTVAFDEPDVAADEIACLEAVWSRIQREGWAAVGCR